MNSRYTEELTESFMKLAATNQTAADALTVYEAELDPSRMLVAHTLIMSFRAFQLFESKGVPFDSITPKLIIDFIKHGEDSFTRGNPESAAQQGVQADRP